MEVSSLHINQIWKGQWKKRSC